MKHLDKVKVWGKEMEIKYSRCLGVQLPKEGQPGKDLTKDYSTSNLHRFKKPGSKNYSNIYPPSTTLHLSNIPASTDEAKLRTAFKESDLPLKSFRFFAKDHKMAVVQMETVDDAVTALIKLHNYQLAESSHLRVSFSKDKC